MDNVGRPTPAARPREQCATDAGEAPRLLLPSESGGLDLRSAVRPERAPGREPLRTPASVGERARSPELVVLGPSVGRCHPSPMKASGRHSSHQRPRCHRRGRPALRGGHVRHDGALCAPGRPLRADRRIERPGEHVPRGGLRRPRRPWPGGDRKQLGSGLLRVRAGSPPHAGLRRVCHLRAGAAVLDRGH